jgi:lipopolysaccharide transport system ATP-binding protein
MSEYAIIAEQVGKRYLIGAQLKRYETIRESVVESVKAPFQRAARLIRGESDSAGEATEEFWALTDVSFQIKKGEVLGVVGANGAGKSTLLKILSRITEPTEGCVRIIGRVGSLLEVGTGFHPELTGRENTFLSGTILGMRRAEIERNFDDIVSFAGVERYIDTPVKHYSSGMYVRLAFAVAAFLEPEILIIDEVLAVGDADFRKRCLGKMNDVANSGRTVIFVSHNLSAITTLCSRAVLLSHGRLVQDGPVYDVISEYMKPLENSQTVSLAQRTDRKGSGQMRFTDIVFLDEQDRPVPTASPGKPLTILLGYETANDAPVRNVDVDIAFYGPFGQLLLLCKAELTHGGFEVLPGGRRQLRCHIPKFPLSPSSYRVKLWCEVSGVLADRIEDATRLTVESGDFYGSGFLPKGHPDGIVLVDHQWRVSSNGASHSVQ